MQIRFTYPQMWTSALQPKYEIVKKFAESSEAKKLEDVYAAFAACDWLRDVLYLWENELISMPADGEIENLHGSHYFPEKRAEVIRSQIAKCESKFANEYADMMPSIRAIHNTVRYDLLKVAESSREREYELNKHIYCVRSPYEISNIEREELRIERETDDAIEKARGWSAMFKRGDDSRKNANALPPKNDVTLVGHVVAEVFEELEGVPRPLSQAERKQYHHDTYYSHTIDPEIFCRSDSGYCELLELLHQNEKSTLPANKETLAPFIQLLEKRWDRIKRYLNECIEEFNTPANKAFLLLANVLAQTLNEKSEYLQSYETYESKESAEHDGHMSISTFIVN